MKPAAQRFSARRTTGSARATWQLGRRLGAALRHGDVVALIGDLGAGKTQLVRGACAGAGVEQGDVSSPTFAIVQTYRGRLPFHHADLYRLADLDELYATGFMDLPGGDGALVVEWADKVQGWAPDERLEIRMAEVARRPGSRRLTITGTGPRHAALAEVLAGKDLPRATSRPGPKARAPRVRARPGARAAKKR